MGFDLLVASLGQFPNLLLSVWEVPVRSANLNDRVSEWVSVRSLLLPLGLGSEGEEAEEERGEKLEGKPHRL